MARIFVGLKLRLLRHRLAGGGFLAGAGFLLVWLAAVAGGLGGGLLFGVSVRLVEDWAVTITVLSFTVLGLVWVVVPVILASLDDSLDPRAFELLPLTPRRLAAGLLTAGLVGPGAVATILGLGLGLTIAFGGPVAAVPLVVVAAVMLLLCVAAARYATTRLSDLLRRRRGQEVALLILILMGTAPGFLSVALTQTATDGGRVDEALVALAGVATWTPWGALGRAAVALGSGEWLAAVGGLAYGAAATAAAVALFARSLHRMSVTAPTASVRKVGREGSRLLPRRLPLPATPAGAVAAKELISMRRDVRVRSQLLGGLIALLVLAGAGSSMAVGTQFAPFASVLAVFVVVTSVTPNQFGFDGGSFWGYLTMAPDLGVVIRGKNLAWALVGAPVALVVAVAGGIVGGTWVYVPAALLGAVVVGLVWMGVGNVTSVLGAFRLPESNLFGSRNLSGAAVVATFAGISVSGVLTGPPLLAVGVLALLTTPVWVTVASLLSVVYGVFVYRLGARTAARLAHERRFRLLATLDGD